MSEDIKNFTVYMANNRFFEQNIAISTIKELNLFALDYGKRLIIDFDYCDEYQKKRENFTILIPEPRCPCCGHQNSNAKYHH